jgi:3-methyladenine DNA glycosylase AlkD
MPPRTSKSTSAPHRVRSVIAQLKQLSSKKTRDGMARYGIPSDKAFGVPVGVMRNLAKEVGRQHELALALWETGWYEARMLAVFVDEPASVSPAQMDHWCRDFDSWAICDTACFHLFDRTPHAWGRVQRWASRSGEFQKRAAFALLASLALHDRHSDDELFARAIPLVQRGASDDRNFVKKGVSWALRSIGRRSPELRSLSLELAGELASSTMPAERWVGKDVLRDLSRLTGKKK